MVGRSDRCWLAWLLGDKAVAVGQRSALSCQPCSMFSPRRTQASRGNRLSVLNLTEYQKRMLRRSDSTEKEAAKNEHSVRKHWFDLYG